MRRLLSIGFRLLIAICWGQAVQDWTGPPSIKGEPMCALDVSQASSMELELIASDLSWSIAVSQPLATPADPRFVR